MDESVDFLKPMEQSAKSQETNLDAARVGKEIGSGRRPDLRSIPGIASRVLTRPTEAQVANCFGFDRCSCRGFLCGVFMDSSDGGRGG